MRMRISSRATKRGSLIFGQGHHLLPYFVNVSSEDNSRTMHAHMSQCDIVINTKFSCTVCIGSIMRTHPKKSHNTPYPVLILDITILKMSQKISTESLPCQKQKCQDKK